MALSAPALRRQTTGLDLPGLLESRWALHRRAIARAATVVLRHHQEALPIWATWPGDATVSFRVCDHTLTRLERRARAAGLTRSALLREVVAAAVTRGEE